MNNIEYRQLEMVSDRQRLNIDDVIVEIYQLTNEGMLERAHFLNNIYLGNVDYLENSDLHEEPYECVYSGRFNADSCDIEILEEVFALGNHNNDFINDLFRSVSVSDIIVINDKTYMVMPTGFKLIK